MELKDHLFTVSELNNVIKDVLESSFYSINIEGELSNFKPASSGHWYFSLKDKDSNISGVMFINSNSRVNFKPKDGMKVKVKGNLTLYSQRGTYQIVCNEMKLFGDGDILILIEERKRKLASLGLFDPSKKQPLPRIPNTIGIVTSHTGAALQDILKVLKRRHSLSNIIILPTLVQGLTASKIITKQIKKANDMKLCDLLIVSRGGGSIEDLLPFSEECVIYAISESKIPIITGIGHEIDTTLSDLAADVRAATPSAAAELASEGSEQLYSNIHILKKELLQNITNKMNNIKSKLLVFDNKNTKRYLNSKIQNRIIHIDSLKKELISNSKKQIELSRNRIISSKISINNLSPYRLFEKGYAWVTKNNTTINGQKIIPGDNLCIIYKDGKIDVDVRNKI